MRILENRDSIDFLALYGGKVSLETYFQCEEQLKEAVSGDDYICPPLIRTKAKREYFAKRVEEIYRAHQELFLKFNNIPMNKMFCNGPVRPPLSFFGEEAHPHFFEQEEKLLELYDFQTDDYDIKKR
mgnify:CR=1 FL=1